MKTILIVDDNKLNLTTAKTVLSSEYRVVPVMQGRQALTFLADNACDLVLLDINMPDMDGFDILKNIRQIEHCQSMPVIFLTADSDVGTEMRCFEAGALDFIAKPFVPEVMRSRIGRVLELEELRRSLALQLEQKTKEMSVIRDMAQQDALTGLWNRAYTEDAVTELLSRGGCGALMMLDIDNFKTVNDTYGHAVGDGMLQMIADTLRSATEGEDILCRIGGDEFMVFLKNMSTKAQICERAAAIVNQVNAKTEELGIGVNTSISIGIAQAPEDGSEFMGLYSCADKALYYVKRNGKNAFHLYGSSLVYGDEQTVDLQYLYELLGRADTGKGAYQLGMDSFQYIFNFIRRFKSRKKLEVTTLLFTISETEDARAMETLEKTAGSLLRRSDFLTRYSGRQMLVGLPDATDEGAVVCAERIIEKFKTLYTGEPVSIDYAISRIDGRSMPGQI
ncbi:MAG: diguanylate cyclase [Oscillospiraceae bacterium]|nr:diguanylate cyclase [Oscillospiraceae bacterium]